MMMFTIAGVVLFATWFGVKVGRERMAMKNGQWQVGDRVQRMDNGVMRHGTIVDRYEYRGGIDGIQWDDPYVYNVKWDDAAKAEGGYFRLALDAEGASADR